MCEWVIQSLLPDVSLLVALHVLILNTISLASIQFLKRFEL